MHQIIEGGYRESGHGSYILYNVTQELVLRWGSGAPLTRVVSRTMATSLLKTGTSGNVLSGTFYVMSSAGLELIKEEVQSQHI